MQNMDSSITKTQKRNLTDMQEKFLDVLFGEAKGNPREAARIAGYSDNRPTRRRRDHTTL